MANTARNPSTVHPSGNPHFHAQSLARHLADCGPHATHFQFLLYAAGALQGLGGMLSGDNETEIHPNDAEAILQGIQAMGCALQIIASDLGDTASKAAKELGVSL